MKILLSMAIFLLGFFWLTMPLFCFGKVPDFSQHPPDIHISQPMFAREMRPNPMNLVEKIKAIIMHWRFNIHLTGYIDKIGKSQLDITDLDGDKYTIIVNPSLKPKPRLWGEADLNEFSAGDKINIIGRWKNKNAKQIEALMIRNISLQKRHVIIMGQVEETAKDYFKIKSRDNLDLKAYFNSKTEFNDSSERRITATEIKKGDMIRVAGYWDGSSDKVTALTIVKDSLVPPQWPFMKTPK